MRTRVLVSVETTADRCHTCSLVQPCRHDLAVLMDADDVQLVVDTLLGRAQPVLVGQGTVLHELAALLSRYAGEPTTSLPSDEPGDYCADAAAE